MTACLTLAFAAFLLGALASTVVLALLIAEGKRSDADTDNESHE